MTGPIVATTDFSARADRAIDRALLLGAQWGRKVALVHAVEEGRDKVDQAALDAAMESALPEGIAGTDAVEFVYVEGSPPRALAEAAATLGASLIVMGPARYNSLGDYLLGTCVDQALRHCEQPVLIVKRRPHRPYQGIVVATDFANASLKAVRLTLEWFPEAKVHLVHACHVAFEAWQHDPRHKDEVVTSATRRMDAFVEELALPEEQRARILPHVVAGSAHEAVNRVVRDSRADLVVIGSHGESGWRHATIGSMANGLLETTRVDTLMVMDRR